MRQIERNKNNSNNSRWLQTIIKIIIPISKFHEFGTNSRAVKKAKREMNVILLEKKDLSK